MIIRGSLGYFNLSCGIYTVCSTRYRVFVAIVIFYPNSYTESIPPYHEPLPPSILSLAANATTGIAAQILAASKALKILFLVFIKIPTFPFYCNYAFLNEFKLVIFDKNLYFHLSQKSTTLFLLPPLLVYVIPHSIAFVKSFVFPARVVS